MPLTAATPAPLFTAPAAHNPTFAFSSLGGRYLILAFLPEPGPERDAALAVVEARSKMFSDEAVAIFGVLPDAGSFARARNSFPWYWLSDAEGELRRLYALVDADGRFEPSWVVIDPSLRVMGTAPLERGASVLDTVAGFGDPDRHAGVELHAPVLIVPRVFEPELCRRLIAYYEQSGGVPSGVMRERDGKTFPVLDDFKKRRDATIADEELCALTRVRINQRLAPEIAKSFQFEATRIERYIVARYDAEDGGYFRPHRDNTTPGTAHRRFAVSINLNAEDFEGGDLRFPEFGRRTYRPPTGGAVVFSCSLLHEATPVRRGVRYAFLPFLFGEPDEALRQANLHTLATDGA